MAASGHEELRSVPAKVDRIEVYESTALLVLLGRKRATGAWRVLRFNRARAEGETLPAVEEAEEYDAAGAHARIAALSTREAPLTLSFGAVALLGAVRFLEGYYLLFITRLEPIGIIAGHSVFRVEDTAMLSIKAGGFSSVARARAAGSPPLGGVSSTAAAIPVRPGAAPLLPPPTPPPPPHCARACAGGAAGGEGQGAAAACRVGGGGGGGGGTERVVPPSVSSAATAVPPPVSSFGAAAPGPGCAGSSGGACGGVGGAGGAGASEGWDGMVGGGGGSIGRVLQETAASVLAGIKLGSRHLSGRWGERWDEGWAERRYRSLFLAMDLTRDFYFSYTYEISLTLQENMSAHSGGGAGRASAGCATGMGAPAANAGAEGAAAMGGGVGGSGAPSHRDKFIWSHHLMLPLLPLLKDGAWLTPLLHGFFRQVCLSLCGRPVSLTLIARRSRLFAGARLLKRGLCAAGHVANEVETEQLVADGSRGGLHAGHLSSFVQLRGSIPLVWGHGDEGRHIVPRPDIHLQRIDPTFTFTRRHFEELWQRYGAPLVIFDLVRQTEKRPRETIVGKGLAEAIASLQASLSREGHPMRACGLRYVPFDFKKESRRKGGDVLATVEAIAAHMIRRVGFYSSAPPDTLAPPHAARRAALSPRLADTPLPSGLAAPLAPASGAWAASGPGGAAVAAGGGAVDILAGEVRLGASATPGGVRPADATAAGSRPGAEDARRSSLVAADPASSPRSSAASSCLSVDSPRVRTPVPDPRPPSLDHRLLRSPIQPAPPSPPPAPRSPPRLTSRDSDCVSPGTSAASSCASFGPALSRLHAQLAFGRAAAAPSAPRPPCFADLSDDDSFGHHAQGASGAPPPNLAGCGARGRAHAQGGDESSPRVQGGHALPPGDAPAPFSFRQHGVIRTNCIDCLDRTNVAQFCIGRCVLKQQLVALGVVSQSKHNHSTKSATHATPPPPPPQPAVIPADRGRNRLLRRAASSAAVLGGMSTQRASSSCEHSRREQFPMPNWGRQPDSREGRQSGVSGEDWRGDGREGLEMAASLLVSMYEEMGTGLALQYAGSQALNATNSNAAKDLIQSVKRFYRNTFTDVEKQHIIDVFLGVFIPARGTPHIWELESDAHLHNQPTPTLYAPLRMPPAPRACAPAVPPPPAAPAGTAADAATAALPPSGPPPPSTAAHQAAAQFTTTSSSPAPPAAPSSSVRRHALFNDMYGPSTMASFDELLARPFVHPFSPPVLRRPPAPSPRLPPLFSRAASVSLPCAPAAALAAASHALGAQRASAKAGGRGGGGAVFGFGGDCGGGCVPVGGSVGGASRSADPVPDTRVSVSSSSSEEGSRLISPRESDDLADIWVSPSVPRAHLGGGAGGSTGSLARVSGGLAGGGARLAAGPGGRGGGLGGGQNGGYGGGYGFGSAEGAACLASLAAVDDALGGGGGRWGAAGYSEEAMRHATLGQDAQVLLPLGYVSVDEWDRRRRADRIDPAAAYTRRQHTDVACYQRYCDATGGSTGAGGEKGGGSGARGRGPRAAWEEPEGA